jgi:hypothetical protein
LATLFTTYHVVFFYSSLSILHLDRLHLDNRIFQFFPTRTILLLIPDFLFHRLHHYPGKAIFDHISFFFHLILFLHFFDRFVEFKLNRSPSIFKIFCADITSIRLSATINTLLSFVINEIPFGIYTGFKSFFFRAKQFPAAFDILMTC